MKEANSASTSSTIKSKCFSQLYFPLICRVRILIRSLSISSILPRTGEFPPRSPEYPWADPAGQNAGRGSKPSASDPPGIPADRRQRPNRHFFEREPSLSVRDTWRSPAENTPVCGPGAGHWRRPTGPPRYPPAPAPTAGSETIPTGPSSPGVIAASTQ